MVDAKIDVGTVSITEEFSVTASDGKQYREKSYKGKNSKIRYIYCQELLKQRHFSPTNNPDYLKSNLD